MAKTLTITVSKHVSAYDTDFHVDGSDCNAALDEYMKSHGSLLWIQTMPGYVGEKRSVLYRYDGEIVKNNYMTKYVKVSRSKKLVPPELDVSRLVQLGGVFQQVGDKEETTGGEEEKIGSKNILRK